MAGDERRVALEIDPGLGLQHAHGRKRHRHQRRLRILGERQRLGRPFPHDRGELVAERVVDLVEHRARRRKGVGQRLAHADRLAALARKHEGCRHRPIPPGKTGRNPQIWENQPGPTKRERNQTPLLGPGPKKTKFLTSSPFKRGNRDVPDKEEGQQKPCVRVPGARRAGPRRTNRARLGRNQGRCSEVRGLRRARSADPQPPASG